MAINAITLDTLVKDGSTGSVTTLQAVDTATGAYLAVKDKDVSKVIFLVQRDESTEVAAIVVAVGSNYSGISLGLLSVSLATGDTASRQQVHVVGPLDWSRFKSSSNERIILTCTGSTAVEAVGAVLLP